MPFDHCSGADWRQLREEVRRRRVEQLIGRLEAKPRRQPAEEALLARLQARHPERPAPSHGAGQSKDQVRIGTAAPIEWVGLKWFVAVTKAGREREARDYLELAGEPVFLVEERVERRLGAGRGGNGGSGKRTEIDRPLWPGYLFVAEPALELLAMTIDNDERAGLSPLFLGFLGGQDGQLWRVNGADMAALFLANAELRFTPELRKQELRQRFAPGQKVTVLDGPFASFSAIFHSCDKGESARILVQIFGQETPVTTALDNLA